LYLHNPRETGTLAQEAKDVVSGWKQWTFLDAMEDSWPADSTDIVPYEDLTSMKLQSSASGCSIFTAGLENGNRQSVILTVLTVENEESKSRFIQEAALLKLLTHKYLLCKANLHTFAL